jgi:hypothetical protein
MNALDRPNDILHNQLSVGNWYQNLFFYAVIIGLVLLNLWVIKKKNASKNIFLPQPVTDREIILKKSIDSLTADLAFLKKEVMVTGEELEFSYTHADRLSTMLLEVLDCFRTKMEFAEIGYWSLDLQTQELSFSANGMAILGVPKGIRLTIADGLRIIDKEYHSEITNAYEEKINKGIRCVKDCKINPLDGHEPKWVKGSGQLLFNEHGNPSTLSGSFVLTNV